LFHNHWHGCQLAFLNAKKVKSNILKLESRLAVGISGLTVFPT